MVTDDMTRHNDNGTDRDDLTLLYALGEALGDSPSDDDTRRAWAALEARLDGRQRRRRLIRLSLTSLAAAAVALAVILFVPWARLADTETASYGFVAADLPADVVRTSSGGTRTVCTPPATTLTVVLPDGSHVLLGSGSRISYPENFNASSTREIELTGMASFDVRHDSSRPFIVRADGIRTEVLGTVFDVRAYPNVSRQVTLYSGKVRVDDGHGSPAVTLEPGQRALLDGKRGVNVSRTNLQAAAGWTHGMFIFDNERLKDVMNDIGSWYNVSIDFTDRQAASTRVHITLPRSASLSSVIRALNDMNIASFSIAGNKVTIKQERTR